MKSLALNLLLAVAWVLLSGRPTLDAFMGGYLIGFLVLRLVQGRRPSGYVRRTTAAVLFLFYVAWQVVLANLRLLLFYFSPNSRMRPGIVRVPLDLRTPAAITLLANVITLTPGTLTLEVSADSGFLYVHAIDVPSPEALRQEIKRGFERRIAEVME